MDRQMEFYGAGLYVSQREGNNSKALPFLPRHFLLSFSPYRKINRASLNPIYAVRRLDIKFAAPAARKDAPLILTDHWLHRITKTGGKLEARTETSKPNWNTGNKLMKLHYRFSLPSAWPKKEEGRREKKNQPTSTTSCQFELLDCWVCTLCIFSVPQEVQHLWNQPSSSPRQPVPWTGNSTAPLVARKMKAASGCEFFPGEGGVLGLRRAGTQPCQGRGLPNHQRWQAWPPSFVDGGRCNTVNIFPTESQKGSRVHPGCSN